MKIKTIVSLAAIVGATALLGSLAIAQQQKPADMTGMCKQMMNGKCMDHMKDTGDTKGMDGMKREGMGTPRSAGEPSTGMHAATGVVKNVDTGAGTVTVAHGPVKSMNWPAMTMAFKVEDRGLLDKLATGKKVAFDFKQQGSDYVITRVK